MNAQAIAREYFPGADERLINYVLWNCTGFPSFWDGDPETVLRQQLQAAKDGKCEELSGAESIPVNKPLHLVFPARLLPSLNKVYSANRHLRARLVLEAHEAVRAVVWHQLEQRPTPFTIPVSITLRAAYSGNVRDVDNGAKLLLDGLVYAGVLANDDYLHVPELHQYVKRVSKALERIEVMIEPIHKEAIDE